MAETELWRHVDELVQLTTEQYMAWQGNQQYVCEAKHGNSKVIGCMEH